MSETLMRCMFCNFDRTDTQQESAVQASREVAVHLVLAHWGHLDELMWHATDEWVARRLATLDAAHAASPDLATRNDNPDRAAVWFTPDCGHQHLSNDGSASLTCPDRATPASSEAAASQGEDYEPIEVDPEVAEAAARWSRGEPLFGEPARHYATLTRNGKFGAGLWLDGRLVARIVATVEDSRVSEDEPEPRWLRDAMVFVNAVNDAARASQPSPDLATLTRGTALTDDEVETIYAVFDTLTGWEARGTTGRREIVEPLYEAFLAVRNARILGLLATPAASSEAAAPQGDERLREAAARAADFLDHLAEYEQRHLSHVECGGEPGLHDPLIVEASRLRSALDREAGR